MPCGGAPYGDSNLVFVANDWHTALLPVYLQVPCCINPSISPSIYPSGTPRCCPPTCRCPAWPLLFGYTYPAFCQYCSLPAISVRPCLLWQCSARKGLLPTEVATPGKACARTRLQSFPIILQAHYQN